MIDTNQIAQVSQTAAVVKSQVAAWWPTIAVAAAWAGRELTRFNAWAEAAAEKIMAHGGIIKLVLKIFWN